MNSEKKSSEKGVECGGLPPLCGAELAPRSVSTGASPGEQSAGKPAHSKKDPHSKMDPQPKEYGVQPLDKIMDELNLNNHDLVAASTAGLTHKQVQKGRKGRRLTRNIQEKIAVALSAAAGKTYVRTELFNYA